MSTDSVIETVSGSDTKTIEQLIELGNQARKTLGLLPKAVYFDAADKGFLLTVRKEGEPVAYVLFRLPRNEVVLTHVCVEKEHRRSGLAHLLINEVSERYPARLGLRAKCRDDYPNIQDVWRGLGFDRLGPAQGRGNDQAAMTVWWRDHGHPNLFTPVDEPTVLAVAIDVNILMDLHTRSHHPSAERSQVLLAPDVRSRIERTVPGGLERDVERQPAELRGRLVAAASRYRRPHGPPGRAEQLFERLLAGVQAELPNYPRTPQDTGDLWQIAETAAAGIQVFLTWDDRLRNEIAPLVLQIENAPELSRVRVIDPDHLVIHLDELAHAAAYQPRALEGSQFSTELANADSEAVLMTFRDNASGETKQELKERLRALARLTRSHSIIRDEDGTPVGCTASVVDGEILRAPLLRVANHPVAETMARHLLWALRRNARQEGAKIVRIDDPYLSPLLVRAASHESYQQIGNRWHAWVINECGSGLQVSAAANAAHEHIGLGPAALLAPCLPAETAAQYERTWWPAKITDSGLPHFAVAIRPKWSVELFGEPAVLTPRSTMLALGREHVYYRSGRPSALSAPGRILWYLTQDPVTGPGRFIGTSLLDAIETDTPDELYASLAHYGVFTLADVRNSAVDYGKAQALRLSYTELFPAWVSWATYWKLREDMGGPRRIQGPARMPSATFAAIYARGTRLPHAEASKM